MGSKMIVAVAAALVATGTLAADVKSVSRLAFGPDNILFVAYWKGAQVHALTLPAPLRIHEVPLIDVALVKSLEAPGGIGEPGTSCVMPALTNAIFAATGKRIRKLPVGDQARAA